MGLEHGENEVIANPGVSEALRPAARAQDREAQRHNQAPTDADLQVGAGQAPGLVGGVDRDYCFKGTIWASGLTSFANLRAAGLLVLVQAQSDGAYRARSPIRRIWDALSSRISPLPSLLARPFGSRCPPVPHETDESHGNVDLSAGSSMQCAVQTEGARTKQRANQPPTEGADKPTSMTRRALALGLVYWAAGRALQKTNLPVKIDPAFIQTCSCGGNSTNFFPKNSSRPSREEFSRILERASYGQRALSSIHA